MTDKKDQKDSRGKRDLLTSLSIVVLLLGSVLVQAEVTHNNVNPTSRVTFVSDEPWQPEGFNSGLSIPAAYMALDSINIDGKENEPAWQQAEEITVPLSYGPVQHVNLKALYTDNEVFIRVRWPDSSEDREHRPWVWDSTKDQYVEGTQREDSVLLSFEAGCEWTPSLLGGYTYDFDGWHWMAARSDPIGQAVDIYGNVRSREIEGSTRYQSRVTSDELIFKFIDKSTDKLYASWEQLDRVYMAQPVTQTLYYKAQPDGMRHAPPFVKELPAPTNTPYPRDEKTSFPQFSPVKLTGGAGEVSAKGQWEDGYWTVEFRRVRFTPAGFIDDTEFGRLTQFSVHVFNHAEQIDQASESPRLFLQFIEQDDTAMQRVVAKD